MWLSVKSSMSLVLSRYLLVEMMFYIKNKRKVDFKEVLEHPVMNRELDQLKTDLEGWREVVLPMNKILHWEKPHYPAVIVGLISFVFLLIWYFEPSVLTTISLLGLTICLIDFLVPTVASSVFTSEHWTVLQEQQYEQICLRILNAKHHLMDMKNTLNNLKSEKPALYFVLVMGFLTMMAWLGNLMDNLLLTYLLVCFIVLLPGIRSQGALQRYISWLQTKLKDVLAGKPKAKKN
ncbi:ADP-ribosylation factor-like protein 6-interacting protein 1 isoform X1 [Lingula anatina]|uniref:ADP-ribosylation factor-like protein 6-interacting protein 1 isoform X1 n=2 Tax=Lingula anatina TaxID=7574 RepID=A0A1S3I5Z5_LINAN|nr:ADP-ribosylation factor-like protein 6-interacting protein 1 isoform X1 [Lingula anatina]|eukprot:XP_013393628.1 ADP-ribosylation factor-like protein 6-interacting protein 1 isoform X1 [Lingula anatina]